MSMARPDPLDRPQPDLPAVQLRRTTQCPPDPWRGIACDLIERFIDVQCVERGLGCTSPRACREDLRRLDGWMMREFGRTLVTAHAVDLHRYFDACVQSGASMRLVFRALWSMRMFYRFLRDAGCRSDDPAEQLLHPDDRIHHEHFQCGC